MSNIWKKLSGQQTPVQPDPLTLLKNDIRDCEFRLRQNEQLFNLKVEDAMVDAIIFERESLLSRHSYLMSLAREMIRARKEEVDVPEKQEKRVPLQKMPLAPAPFAKEAAMFEDNEEGATVNANLQFMGAGQQEG
ncbi:hypothetical protein LJB77_01195 [Ruminococcaceae bacterium OttesenSCG-928-N02]|nr:hypothetical protein [Ruminococcaceae bacterium OttesenSCG-928-N02]